MKNILRNWLDHKKEGFRKQRDHYIVEEFKVVELDGKIWLTHNGCAFAEIDPKQSADDVIQQLHRVRETAVKYDTLKSIED